MDFFQNNREIKYCQVFIIYIRICVQRQKLTLSDISYVLYFQRECVYLMTQSIKSYTSCISFRPGADEVQKPRSENDSRCLSLTPFIKGFRSIIRRRMDVFTWEHQGDETQGDGLPCLEGNEGERDGDQDGSLELQAHEEGDHHLLDEATTCTSKHRT